jgi:riboflavin kinase/FMN adenylyltransferase
MSMKVVQSLSDAASTVPGVVTIGNFDGVHRGHRAILDTVRERAARTGARSVAMTFDPHPLQKIAPGHAPLPISTLDQRIRLIGESDIHLLLVQEFDDAFRQLSPDRFIQTFLIDALRAECVCVGRNFRFGHRHRGNLDTLREWSRAFELIEAPPVVDANVTISSSRVRALIAAGRVGRARRMLARCYEMAGVVVPGSGRGRRLTVPTLNLESSNTLVPANGVYLSRVSVNGGAFQDALTNVGVRPTFDSDSPGRRTIETHLLDVDLALRAVELRVKFVSRLRDERRFSSVDGLHGQIQSDIAAARRFFRRLESRLDRSPVGSPSGND